MVDRIRNKFRGDPRHFLVQKKFEKVDKNDSIALEAEEEEEFVQQQREASKTATFIKSGKVSSNVNRNTQKSNEM